MFLKVDDEFGDGELAILCELLGMLDKRISEIQSLISRSSDPESDGLCDKGEYFIGVGFAAIQQYLVDTLISTGINKIDAYKLGSAFDKDKTYIELIDSAANWWKHEAEWWNTGKVPKNGERTFAHVTSIADSQDYALSIVLASICGSGSLSSLGAIVPYLKEWRSAVHDARPRDKCITRRSSETAQKRAAP
jgi:hypothetical protein